MQPETRLLNPIYKMGGGNQKNLLTGHTRLFRVFIGGQGTTSHPGALSTSFPGREFYVTGRQFQVIREEVLKMSQDELADLLEVSQATISRWEKSDKVSHLVELALETILQRRAKSKGSG